MDIDTTTRAFTLPTSVLAKLERLAARRNSPVDNTLAAAIDEAERAWLERWPATYAEGGGSHG